MTIDAPHSRPDLAELRRNVLERRLAGRARRASATAGIPRLPRTEPLALSFAQQRLWMLDQLRPGQDEYLIPVAVDLAGSLDEAALATALTELVARHEVLRTRYVLLDREPKQVVDPPSPVRIDRAAGTEEDLQSMIAKLSRAPMDLRREHPIRFHLVELGPRRQVLLICVHHIAFDGWSTGVLLRELSELYSAAAEQRPPALPPVPTQYADYAGWQRDRIRGMLGEGQLEHWRTQLAGLDDLALFTDRPHPAEWDSRGAAEKFVIPAAVAEALRSVGRGAGATSFVTLLAAVQAFLSRYCGQRDIAVGVPSAGRPRADLAETIGYFGNMLVMRADLSADPTFTGLLRQVRTTAVAAYANQDVPFDRLVTELRSHRDLSRNPLFQASLTVEEGSGGEELALTGLTARTLEIDWTAAKFDLSFAVTVTPAGDWTGDIVYPTALFDRDTIRRMAGHFVAFVAAIAAEPDRPVAEIGFAAGNDRPVADETTHIPVTGAVHEAVERAAAAAGERVAIHFGDERYSYRDLNERANRLARHLLALGVGGGTLVGVRLARGPELVIALLAVLKTGAAYLPLDPDQPDERVNFMIDDAAAAVVITESRFAAGLDARLVVVDDGATRAAVAALPGADLGRAVDPDDLAYVMYTSGSTGRPKGVMVTHRNVLRLFRAIDRDLATGPDDVWTVFHSYAFDFSVWEIWGALVHGSRMVLVPFETSRSPDEFLRLLADEQVTVLSQTPSAFAGLTRALQERGSLSGLALRAVVFGGEALDPTLLVPWFRLGGSDTPRMINMYGITETTVHVTYRELGEADCRARAGVGRSPIGRPLADLSLHVLDPAGRPVPTGVPGEIYVGGAGVARGYLGRAALTAERFVPDPFGTEPGARLYRTGDLARRTPDGQIEFLGRTDQQVKIRGHRIELGEIEAALSSHPSVAAAVVDVRWSGSGNGRIFGYVVLSGEVELDEIRRHAATRLPRYMMPAAVVAIPRIPLTVNGKLDRSQLPPPRLESTVPYLAPRSAAETTAAEVLSEVLEVPRVGVHDNFFALGGDSIRAVRAVGMLRAQGFAVSVADLFRRQTAAEIAELAGGTVEADALTQPFALLSPADRDRLPDGVVDAYPLAQTQAGMLFELLLDDRVHRYHNVTAYPVRERGTFSLDALHRAAQHVTARHDILRTSFDVTTFSEPMQLVHREATLDIRYTDLRSLPADQRESRLWDIISAERADLFDVGTAPLWRLHVVPSTPECWHMCLVEFHPVLDGWSHNSLVTELLHAYEAYRDGGAPEPGRPGAVRFADFIALEQASIRSADDREFWAQRVTGDWERVALPELWAGPTGALTYEVRVPLDESEPGLRELARIAGVPYKTVLFAAYLRVLGIATGQERFFAGVVSNGRPEALGGDDVRGMFLNTIPFAAPAVPDTWVQYVQDVFAEEIAVHAHRHYPLPVMQADWGGDSPLLETAFNFINFHVLDRELVDVETLHDVSPTQFALALSTGDNSLGITARPERVAPEYGEMLGRLLTQVLTAMAGAPHGDPRRCLLDPADRRRALALAAGPVEPLNESFVDLVDRWAVERADEPAVCDPAGDLTYADLQRRSGQVAAGLRARGAGPERVVGISLPRGRDLVVAMLGVLRAGAAFLILDPAQPAARRKALLHEAGALLLIGHDQADLGVPVLSPASFAELSPVTDPVRVAPDTLAYLISTSGSTGRPKNVMLTHRGLLNLVGSHLDDLGVEPGDRIAQLAPVVFDMALFEMMLALTRGATVCIPDPEVLAVGDVLTGLLGQLAVTHLVIVPSALDVLDPDSVPSLRVVAVAGETCPEQLAERWSRRVRFFNLYGPSEYTTMSTGTEIVPGRENGLTIGRPIANTTAYVLDSQLDLVPIGVPGELCLGGLGVGRGYAGRPDLTADRFLPDEFSGVPGARLYRTGDRVIRRQDGELVFLGRIDHQVKINGHRIELGEIETVLQAHPAVRQAVAVVRGEDERRHLMAFVTAAAGSSVNPGDLERFLRDRLAAYLVPARIVPVAELPRNATGKIDRAALAVLPLGDDHRAAPVLPRNELEARVAAVWQRVLRTGRVGVHDDFFDLGGHSLLAVRLAAQLSDTLGSVVSVADVVRRRTIAEIAAAVAAGETDSGGGPLHWFRSTGNEAPLLCVHPGGGDIHWYERLAEIMPEGQPVGAFRFPGAAFPGAGSTVELARHYLDQLDHSVTGAGVRLLGWCGGSAIAWEMARLLTESGVPVRLALVDPGSPLTDADEQLRAFEQCENLFTRLAAGDDGVRTEAFALLATLLDEELPEEDLTDEAWLHRVRGWSDLLKATFSYHFQPARWPVDLIFGDEIAAGTHTVLQGIQPEAYTQSWRDLVTDVPHTWTAIPGSHLGIVEEPHVTRLAEVLTSRWSAA
ncbi:amino acid adenylation domain-containing protein [Micromonospora viridifaciens]|uniref:Amino acid adenylation domain-containing protein n=1 Tax=Micromonospora viridifaciens TaxID=1881 RepID=A0A1C4X143_MICVI|nr:non-ribosomal peptide synthetase [Micromonospora viridifaciens]SCF02169.1 amino acid adenylation domain-containing protein [Micromonospora viridifaciens]